MAPHANRALAPLMTGGLTRWPRRIDFPLEPGPRMEPTRDAAVENNQPRHRARTREQEQTRRTRTRPGSPRVDMTHASGGCAVTRAGWRTAWKFFATSGSALAPGPVARVTPHPSIPPRPQRFSAGREAVPAPRAADRRRLLRGAARQERDRPPPPWSPGGCWAWAGRLDGTRLAYVLR